MNKVIARLYTPEPLTVAADTSIERCIQLMRDKQISSLVIAEAQRPIGIYTEADMVRTLNRVKDLQNTPISDLMSTPVITAAKEINAFEAGYLFTSNNIRHLVITHEDGTLAGILTQTDLVSHYGDEYFNGFKSVSRMMSRKLLTVEPQTPAREVINQMEQITSGCAVALVEGRPAGILTERDMAKLMINQAALDELTMADVMTAPVFSSPADISPLEAITLMNRHKVRRIVVADNQQKLLGILVQEDLIRNLENNYIDFLKQTLLEQDQTLKQNEKHLQLAAHVFDSAIEGIIVTDAGGTIQSVNPAFSEITGYSAEEAVGQNTRLLKSNRHPPEFYRQMWRTLLKTGTWQGEIWNRRKNGETFPERLTISSVKNDDGRVTLYTAVFFDITDLKEKEAKISHRAYHDPLTELPNRQLFSDRLNQALIRARRKNSRLAVMFIDVDHFKKLNDTLGHYAGDQFLQSISTQLQAALREHDTVARFSGDEFTILMDDIHDINDAVTVAEKILCQFNQPFRICDQEVYMGASIGIARYPNDGNEAETLIKNADTAMYHAKQNGRNTFSLFKSQMAHQIKERITIERELREALVERSFEIHYQPIIDLQSGRIDALEALLRWQRPGKALATERFISIADESGLILPLGKWMMLQAGKQLNSWLSGANLHQTSEPRLSINLSKRQLRQQELRENLVRLLDESGLSPELLQLEITETGIIEDLSSAAQTLSEIRALGVRIVLDDFGVGHSSLNCLTEIPLDALKLDNSFIKRIGCNAAEEQLISGIIAIAKGLGLEVIAEGVENEQQLNFLKQNGCNKAQGFLFQPPAAADTIAALLDGQREYS